MANIHLDDMFTTGLNEFNEIKKTNSTVDEALLKNLETIVKY